MYYNTQVEAYGNRIDKLRKITIFDIDDQDRMKANQYSKENSSAEQNSSLYNQIYA